MKKYELYNAVVKEWYKANPAEAAMFLQAVREARLNRLNEFASSKSKALRWGLSIHKDLYRRLKKADPEFLTTKTHSRNFMRAFPGFKVAQKI